MITHKILLGRLFSVLYFFSWSLIALYNPVAISTILIPFLGLLLVFYYFFTRTGFRIDIWVFVLFFMLFLNFLFNGLFGNKESIRWFLAFSASFLTSYFLIKSFGTYIVLSVYYKFAVLISCVCVFQQLAFFSGFSMIYDLSWLGIESRVTFSGAFLRVTAFFAEPAHLGFFLMYPSLIALLSKKSLSSMLILLAFIMTFSVGNYMMLALLLSSYYLLIEKKISFKRFITIFFVFFCFILFVIYIPALNQKLISLFAVGNELLLPENRSKAAPFFLILVNLSSFIDNPFLGNGFGTRMEIYADYLPYFLNGVDNLEDFVSDEVFMAKLLGETGILGVSVFFLIILSRWRESSNTSKIFLLIFFIASLKSGTYFNPALFFFLNVFLIKERHSRI